MWGNRTSSWVLGALGVFSVLGAVGLATAAPVGATPASCTSGSTGSSGTCTLYTPNGTFNVGGTVDYTYDASKQELTMTVSGTGSITAGPWLCLGSSDMSSSLLEPADQCTPNGPLATGTGQSFVSPVSSSGDTFVFDVPVGDFWFMHLDSGGTLEAAATNAVAAAPSDPGTNDPGTNDPGTNDPGANDPGTNNPGSSDPSTNDPGANDPGANDSSSAGSADPGSNAVSQAGPSDPASTGGSDPGDPSAPAAVVPQALEGATNARTGEPWAGSKPYEVVLAGLGILLVGIGAIMRRRATRLRTVEVSDG
jgi:hypothetical protein